MIAGPIGDRPIEITTSMDSPGLSTELLRRLRREGLELKVTVGDL